MTLSPLTIRVNLAQRGYDVHVATDNLIGVGAFARQRAGGNLAFLVVDNNVDALGRCVAAALNEARFQTALTSPGSGEEQKSLAVASTLYDRLQEARADRETLVVAVGGGVIGDLAGFVAATYARGLPLLMVPTTLLAMVDSSVGGKVGVNHPRAKNLIGAFHQPVGVWIDTSVLATLPDREYRSGLAEVVKYGVILDPELFEYLEKHADAILAREPEVVRKVIADCCRLKAAVVEQDEREESGRRVVLNYGHTFAHAFEKAAGFGRWLHGEAVAAGMVCASRLAERLGLIPGELTLRQTKLLERFGLPTAPRPWPVEDLITTMRSDKKASAGKLRFVLPRRLGEVALFDDIAEADVGRVLEHAHGNR